MQYNYVHNMIIVKRIKACYAQWKKVIGYLRNIINKNYSSHFFTCRNRPFKLSESWK